MVRGLAYRILLTCINIFMPPLSVAMLAGFEWDCMINCLLFLCAVIPSHIHGFYISCTYFHRRRKVKKGRYPGGPKPLIHSRNVLNGGASNAEVDRLWRQENGLSRSNSRRSARGSMSSMKKSEMMQRDESEFNKVPSNGYRRPDGRRQDAHVSKDGYGPVQRTSSRSTYASYSPVSPVSSKGFARR